jgi:hypothetical protein
LVRCCLAIPETRRRLPPTDNWISAASRKRFAFSPDCSSSVAPFGSKIPRCGRSVMDGPYIYLLPRSSDSPCGRLLLLSGCFACLRHRADGLPTSQGNGALVRYLVPRRRHLPRFEYEARPAPSGTCRRWPDGRWNNFTSLRADSRGKDRHHHRGRRGHRDGLSPVDPLPHCTASFRLAGWIFLHALCYPHTACMARRHPVSKYGVCAKHSTQSALFMEFAATSAICILIAFFVSLVTERKTGQVRAAMLQMCPPRADRGASERGQ